MLKESKPYQEEEKEDYVIREFKSSVTEFELVWHRDKEDRYIQAIDNNDWSFQLDNEIPMLLGKTKLFIPKETYHRLIKGTGDVSIKVWKIK